VSHYQIVEAISHATNTMAVVDLHSLCDRESALSHKSVVFILEEFDLFAQVIAYVSLNREIRSILVVEIVILERGMSDGET